MHATIGASIRLTGVLAACLLATPTVAVTQQPGRRQPPPPADVDARLTEAMRGSEQRFADAILHNDSAGLERILAPEYTLRIADVPEGSMPRRMWLDNTLHRLRPQSVELLHVAARRLAEHVAAVSLIFRQKGTMEGRDFSGDFYIVDFWKQNARGWQVVARYSSPVSRHVDRGSRQPPPPADVDAALTDTLGGLERKLAGIALNGFRSTEDLARLVASEFTARSSDAPERSLTRAAWARPVNDATIEALDERFHAARRLANDLAVVSFVLSQKTSVAGSDRSGDSYVMDIWRRRAGHWQLIARYSSPASPALGGPTPPASPTVPAGLSVSARGRGPDVVLVHGALGDFRQWAPVGDSLASGYHVFAVSRRFHWPNLEPPARAREYSLVAQSEDLVQMLRALGAPAHVVGHSYGAGVVLLAALSHPELVRSVVLIEPPLSSVIRDSSPEFARGVASRDSMVRAVRANVQAGNDDAAAETLMDWVQDSPGGFRKLPADVQANVLANARTIGPTYEVPFPPVSCDQLRTLRAPVLVLRGERTSAWFRLLAEGTARCLPNAESDVIPGGAHMVPVENPVGTADRIRRFLATH